MHVVAELPQEKDSLKVWAGPEALSDNLKFLPTRPEVWAGRKEPLSLDGTKMRQR